MRRGRKPMNDEKLIEIWMRGGTLRDAIDATGMSVGGIRRACERLNIVLLRQSRQGRPRASGRDIAREARAKSNGKARGEVKKIRDRRRVKEGVVPTGTVRFVLPAKHRAVLDAETLHPHTLHDASEYSEILTDGAFNSKIGGDVLVGELKGAKIFTLTLEERATCPKTCGHWRTCYGNAMSQAKRWHRGPVFERALAHDVAQRCAEIEKVLIRLHVLGDFYNVEYARLWQSMLARHENLHVFGFTAHRYDSRIGRIIDQMNRAHVPARSSIRFSGTSEAMGSFTIDFPTNKKRLGDAIVCPEQRHAMNGTRTGKHCGNCALCWQSEAPIVFVEH